MSAKLLYSLSDENPNLQKQIGCMNGFLQFFDRRHGISSRSINSHSHNRRLPQGESSHQGREANGTSKRSKEKHQKVVKEMQGNPTEPSRVSVSSSTGSTLSSLEYDWATKPEQTPLDETIFTDTHSRDSRTSQTFSSPNTIHRFHMKNVVVDSISTCGSPIRTPKREHIDSPRFGALNESFRSVSSNRSVPITPLRRKDAPRLSYDGTETRETFVSGLKIGDLPRLSLDSRQRTINKSGKGQNLPEEPGSYRSPSNIVAKLMGLEAVSDCSSSTQSQICGSRDSLSRSSRTIDESKLSRVLDSPRYNIKDFSTPQPNNAGLISELEEVNSEPQNHSSVTVYGEIERRLADIDFKKSGKDLRALKQILEAIHREKIGVIKRRNDNQSLDSAPQTTQAQGPRKENRQNLHATCPTLHRSEEARIPEDIKSPRSGKKDKVVTRKERGPSAGNVPPERLPRLGFCPPASTIRNSVESKPAKDTNPKTNRGQRSAATSLRPLKTKVARHITEVNVKNSAKIAESPSSKTSGSRAEQHNQLIMTSRSQNQTPSQNSTEFSTNSGQEGKAHSWLPENNSCFSLMKSDTLTHASDNKHPKGNPSDGPLTELAISVREQPSPVSVLDSTFYEDESPSPIKKKPTTFQGFYADDESTDSATEAEWKEKDFSYSPHIMGSSLSYNTHYREQENFKQSAQTQNQLNSNKGESITRPLHKEANLEKAYVAEILLASGFLHDLNLININHCAPQFKEPINPNLFLILEHATARRLLSYSKPNMKTNDKHRRKLIFDAVNEIVSQKVAFSNKVIGVRTGQELFQDICKEINQLHVNSSNQSLDDGDDFLTTIIERDLTHRSGNWTDISSETPGLVLDVERLIFKDLIVELIHDEASHA